MRAPFNYKGTMIEDTMMWNAIETVVADGGKEDDDLVCKIYKELHDNLGPLGIWNYKMIDKIFDREVAR